MAEVTLKGVCKVYEDQSARVVTDVNLQIADREFVVLVGPSGCGKSTTLRMIAGLEDVSEGEIRIGGRVVNDVSPSERDIAMVFQDYALYPHMTVYQNMAFSLKLRNLARVEIDRRVQEAARMLSLEPYLERRPKALSGGQRQRVAMGRAIVREPAVFLFDEPLSNLDAKMRVQMRAELAHLHERLDATMIYVTHDQIEAMTLGDRIVVMSGGVVQQCAAPLTVYAYPANAFVARFIGTPPMNLFEGQLAAVGDTFEFVSSRFRIPLPAFMRPALVEAAGKPVLFGVRPEDLRLVDAADGAIPAIAKLKETLGNELIVHLEQDGKPFLCRVDPYSGPRLNGPLHLRPVLERCHVFDAATELNLTAAVAQQRSTESDPLRAFE